MSPVTTQILQFMFDSFQNPGLSFSVRLRANIMPFTRSVFPFVLLLAGFACKAEIPATMQPCVTCHGANGVAVQPGTPHLNAQLSAFLGDAMRAFAAGSRPTSIPEHKLLPDGDIAQMAHFYSSQKAALRPKQQVDPAVFARGEKVYGNRCSDCHGDAGRESDKDAPLMAAQDRDFMVKQALLFKSGGRKYPFMMDDAYRGLSDEDLIAAAEYFAAQDQFAVAVNKKRRRQ